MYSPLLCLLPLSELWGSLVFFYTKQCLWRSQVTNEGFRYYALVSTAVVTVLPISFQLFYTQFYLVTTLWIQRLTKIGKECSTFCEVCLGDDVGVYIHEYPVYRHKSFRSPRRSLVGTWCFYVSCYDFVLHKHAYLSVNNEQANTNIIYQLIQTRYEDSGKVFRYWKQWYSPNIDKKDRWA